MSTLVAEVKEVSKVYDHSNADRLSVVEIGNWCVISSKLPDGSHRYKKGDKLVYLPPDSVIDEKLSNFLFSEQPDEFDENGNLKSKGIQAPAGGRLKAIKIRGLLSYGMSIDITPELESLYPGISRKKIGESVVKLLNIKKYEPPEPPDHLRGAKEKDHPLFKKYTDIENIKNYDRILQEGEEVSVTLKIHGTSARYALFKAKNISLIQKVVSFFTKQQPIEFCVGSRNKRVRFDDQTYLDKDVYTRIAAELNIKSKLKIGEEIFGEIFGPGIQKGFTYGLKQGEIKFLVYDVSVNGQYLDRDAFVSWCQERGFETCPEVYRGPFDMQVILKLAGGKGHKFDQGIPCREGVVVKPVCERISPTVGRIVLKDTSEFH